MFFKNFLDNLERAQAKLKKAEVTSDVQSHSDAETEIHREKKRQRIAPRKLYESDENEDSDYISEELPRPPFIKQIHSQISNKKRADPGKYKLLYYYYLWKTSIFNLG